MQKKLIQMGLGVIIGVSALEILFYFFFIFKPLDRLAGRDIGVPRGVPTTSELFTSPLMSPYITRFDETKKFYSYRLGTYSDSLKSVVADKSSFVKVAEADYAVGGNVVVIKGNTTLGYDITLTNSTKAQYIEHLDPSESQFAKVFIRKMSVNNLERSYAELVDVKVGDFLLTKRSANLLNPAETNIEIEILREQ